MFICRLNIDNVVINRIGEGRQAIRKTTPTSIVKLGTQITKTLTLIMKVARRKTKKILHHIDNTNVISLQNTNCGGPYNCTKQLQRQQKQEIDANTSTKNIANDSITFTANYASFSSDVGIHDLSTWGNFGKYTDMWKKVYDVFVFNAMALGWLVL